jgi:hypothetical protein
LEASLVVLWEDKTMAIGDTVQAGLGRMDFSAFQTAGAAQARANEAFGNALGQAATAYFEGKEKKEQKNALKEYLMRNGANEEDANAMTKSPQALEMFNQKLARDQQMDIAKLRVAAQRAEGGANRAQVAAKMEDEQKKEQIATDFKQKLLSETVDPAVQANFEQAQPGLFALGGDPTRRNQFLEAQRDQQPKVIAGELGSSDFARFAQDNQLDPNLAYNRFIKLQEAEADLAESNRIDPKDAIDLKNKEETTRQLFDKPLNDLSANFDKNKQVQDYKNVVISYNTISSAAENPSAAGDLSLIFQYMKVLDPGSTVREGEFANAQNAAGVPDRIRNLFNNWSKGQRLDENQRQDFITQAKKIVDARGKSIDPLIRQTRQKFDRTINKQNRNLTPDQADLLFEEVIFPDIKLPQNAQSKGQPPQNQGSSPPPFQPTQLPSGGRFTPIR